VVGVIDRRYIDTLVEDWAVRLNLQHWDIKVMWDEPADQKIDTANIIRDYDYAKIHLAGNWPTWSKDIAQRTIVHELMHLVTRDLEQVCADMEEVLGRLAWAVFEKRHNHELEAVVDRMATVLVFLGGDEDVPVAEEAS
jgi:hypothetical protein